MSAVLAGSELDTKCQILTTSPALTSGACRAGWLVYDTAVSARTLAQSLTQAPYMAL
jgi:hypothetical protein